MKYRVLVRARTSSIHDTAWQPITDCGSYMTRADAETKAAQVRTMLAGSLATHEVWIEEVAS